MANRNRNRTAPRYVPAPTVSSLEEYDELKDRVQNLDIAVKQLTKVVAVIDYALGSLIEDLYAEADDPDAEPARIAVDPDNPSNEVDLAEEDEDAWAQREAERLRAEARASQSSDTSDDDLVALNSWDNEGGAGA